VLQYFVSLAPCPLCIVQRFFYLLIGLVALFASFDWWKHVSVRMYGMLIVFLALLGGGVAFRQVWMQHFPTLVDPTKCVVPFGSFLNSVILSLGGVGSCSVRDWTLFGLSVAEWSLACFVFLLLVGIFLIRRENTQDEYLGV
jgi:disulfide bond formation protein DsbB